MKKLLLHNNLFTLCLGLWYELLNSMMWKKRILWKRKKKWFPDRNLIRIFGQKLEKNVGDPACNFTSHLFDFWRTTHQGPPLMKLIMAIYMTTTGQKLSLIHPLLGRRHHYHQPTLSIPLFARHLNANNSFYVTDFPNYLVVFIRSYRSESCSLNDIEFNVSKKEKKFYSCKRKN